MEFFGQDIPKDMQGKPLRPVIEKQEKIHDYVLFGYHEGHCNITDGRFVYMKAPVDGAAFYEYTLMPTHMQRRFGTDELQNIELQEPFSFTKGCRTMKIAAREGMNNPANFGTKLFDLKEDPGQEHPVSDIRKETELANEMLRMMHEDDCPVERYARFGFPSEGNITEEEIEKLHRMETVERIPEGLKELEWEPGAVNMFYSIRKFQQGEDAAQGLEQAVKNLGVEKITVNHMMQIIRGQFPKEQQAMVFYFAMLASRTV